VTGTKILLEACKAEGIKRVMICSSCGVFGPSKNGKAVDESNNNFHRLTDPYELSKYGQVVEARNFLDSMEIVFV
jgi:nucleoside-diphosphate-sugar epimerase